MKSKSLKIVMQSEVKIVKLCTNGCRFCEVFVIGDAFPCKNLFGLLIYFLYNIIW